MWPSPRRLTFFDRLGSNNAARVRLWLYARHLEHTPNLHLRPTTHAEQQEPFFRNVNPQGKVPALIITATDSTGMQGQQHHCDPIRLYEAAVIARYLEESYLSSGAADALTVIPPDAESAAHMELVIRTHDLYLASPNSTQPGNTHTQGCMYLAPVGGTHGAVRSLDRASRASKLKECWTQLDHLETLLVGPHFAGEQRTLADLAVMPTLVFFDYLAPTVFGWRGPEALFHRRPKLEAWFERERSLSEGRRVEAELRRGLEAKEASGELGEIRDDLVRGEEGGEEHKWVYP
jgi:glutathione S-transferase